MNLKTAISEVQYILTDHLFENPTPVGDLSFHQLHVHENSSGIEINRQCVLISY